MKIIHTNGLAGKALDWAVEQIEIQRMRDAGEHVKGWWVENRQTDPSPYSTDWNLAGPIIERELIELSNWGIDGWEAKATDYSSRPNGDEVFAECYGETALIAAMRCFVASKRGDEVEIPEGLA